jgi:hypothetical protein
MGIETIPLTIGAVLGQVHTWTGNQTFGDNVFIIMGDDSDGVLALNTAVISADAEVTGLIEGTSDHLGTAANSIILSNITNDGDIHLLVSKGGNSHTAFLADGSTGDTILNASSGQSVDLYVAGTKEYDFGAAAVDFNSNNVTNMGTLNTYTVADMATHSVTLFPEAGTGTGVTEASSVGRGPCVSFGDNSAEQAAFYLWYCPASFNTMTKAVVRCVTTASGEDVRLEALGNIDANGETLNSQQTSISASNVTLTQNVWAEYDISGLFTGLAAGDQVQIRFQRIGNHGDDAITTLEVSALDIEWT